MNKVELEAKVDSLTDELNFLRALYDAVITILLLFEEGKGKMQHFFKKTTTYKWMSYMGVSNQWLKC